jgi:hypothetical protein
MGASNEPVKISVSEVVSVRFTFADGDWCEAHLNETTGVLTLGAGHGTYSHGWRLGSNLGIEAPYTLRRGIAGFGVDYLANKLLPCSHSRYDEEATKKAVLNHAKMIYTKVPQEDIDRLDFSSPDSLSYTSGDVEWLEEPWLLMVYSETLATRLLRERYLPALKNWV